MINRLEPPIYLRNFDGVKQWLTQAYRRFVQFETGSFTGTLTGFTATVTGTVDYSIVGDIVTLSVATDITGTSNATTMTLTGMPADLYPSGTRGTFARIQDNTTTYAIVRASVSSTGTITFYTNASTGAFAAANTKGLLACTLIYKI